MDTREDWRPSAPPPEIIDLGDVVIRRYAERDAESLDVAIGTSIDHLRPWMDWISHEPVPVEDRRVLIRDWIDAWTDRRNFVMGVFRGDDVVGSTGLHLRGGPGVIEIGYWVRADETGKGLATRVARALVTAAFDLTDVESVEIHHDAANVASGRVAENAGFSLVGEFERTREAPGEIGRTKLWAISRVR